MKHVDGPTWRNRYDDAGNDDCKKSLAPSKRRHGLREPRPTHDEMNVGAAPTVPANVPPSDPRLTIVVDENSTPFVSVLLFNPSRLSASIQTAGAPGGGAAPEDSVKDAATSLLTPKRTAVDDDGSESSTATAKTQRFTARPT